MTWVFLDRLLEAVERSINVPSAFDDLLLVQPVEPAQENASAPRAYCNFALRGDALLRAQLRSVKNSFRRSRAAELIENALHNEDIVWFEVPRQGGLARRNVLLKAEVLPLLARRSAEFDTQFKICVEHDLTLETAGFFRPALSGTDSFRLMQVAFEKPAIDHLLEKYNIQAVDEQPFQQPVAAACGIQLAPETQSVVPDDERGAQSVGELDRHAHSSRITEANEISKFIREVTYEIESAAATPYVLEVDGARLFRKVWAELVRLAEQEVSNSLLKGGKLFKPERAKKASYHLVWRDPGAEGGERLIGKELIRKRVLPDTAR